MTTEPITTLEIYIKRTDADGRETYTEHVVWDVDLFMKTRNAEAKDAGGKAKVERISRIDYLKALGR